MNLYGFLLRGPVFRAIERLNRRFSHVPTTPFIDPAQMSWVAEIEAATPAILGELRAIGRDEIPNFQDISLDQASLTQGDAWKTFFLYGMGNRNDENCARCPATDAAVRRIPGMTTAMFSILSGNKKIPPHRGPYNGVLRYHLGLVVPEPERCWIRVGDETRRWAVGKSLIFDDSYEHEVANASPQVRVVLFVDVLRPLPRLLQLLNCWTLEAIRRSPFVSEAAENLLRFNAKQREAALARMNG